MDDVARLAGVSKQTVSRVLNDHPSVRPETREAVLDGHAHARLPAQPQRPVAGQRPDPDARGHLLRRGPLRARLDPDRDQHGRAGGRLPGQLHRPGHGRPRHGRRGRGPAVGRGRGRRDRHRARSCGWARPWRTPDLDTPLVVLENELRRRAPRWSPATPAPAPARPPSISSASATATVWHIAGPTGWTSADHRLASWRATLEAAGAEVPEPLFGDWSADSGYDLGRRLARRPDVTAVFVSNDQMALGVLHALHEAGRSVPGDVSVVGYDDIPEAAHLLPPLTTVRTDFAEIGTRSLRLLLSRIDGPASGPGPTPSSPSTSRRRGQQRSPTGR